VTPENGTGDLRRVCRKHARHRRHWQEQTLRLTRQAQKVMTFVELRNTVIFGVNQERHSRDIGMTHTPASLAGIEKKELSEAPALIPLIYGKAAQQHCWQYWVAGQAPGDFRRQFGRLNGSGAEGIVAENPFRLTIVEHEDAGCIAPHILA